MTISFDANKILKENINKVMDTVSNPICNTLSTAYTLLTKQVETIVTPAAFFKAQIIDSIDSATTEIFNEISSALNLLSDNIPKVNLQINASTLQELNIFKKTCLDFNDILPNAMKNLIDEGIDSINEFAEDTFDEFGNFIGESYGDFPDFDLPDEMQDYIDDSVDFFKENALSDALSDAASLALSPLTMYRDFIKSSGVIDLLKRMQKFEKCMTNPKNCNRPKKEFYYTGTKKYNSQYYMDLLAINLKGEIQIKKITGQVKGIETKAAKTMKALDIFNQPLIKR